MKESTLSFLHPVFYLHNKGGELPAVCSKQRQYLGRLCRLRLVWSTRERAPLIAT